LSQPLCAAPQPVPGPPWWSGVRKATTSLPSLLGGNAELGLKLLDKQPFANLEMELHIGRGRGYVPSEELAGDYEDDVQLMPIDAIFTPVKKVQFEVDNVRVGQRTDYEKLTMNVQTDGSLNAKEALTIAGKILKEHIEKFITEKIEEPFTHEEEEVDAEKQELRELLSLRLLQRH
jgi:DNA-directed RNA polymerase alpha subunit